MTTKLTKKERYLAAARGETPDRPPVWIMRQAGRYMPEYRELRARYSFLDFCLNPEVAATASLLPLEKLDLDILIIFNDILIPLRAMGQKVEFPEGGPRISNPVQEDADLAWFRAASFSNPEVAQSIRLLKERAGADVPVLGFCGAPFTLACYAVEGRLSRNLDTIKRIMYAAPERLEAILGRLAETAANYLIAQVREGGADGVQVFESWGGALGMPHDYERFAARWQRELIRRFREACPGVPVHLFVRGTAGRIASMEQTGADVLSIDWSLSLAEARRQTGRAIQGNLDPAVLVAGGDCVEGAFARMIEGFDWRRGWIANLGHGITPEASVAAAKKLVECVKALGDA